MRKIIDEWHFLIYALPVPFLAIGILGGVYGSYFSWIRLLVSVLAILCICLERPSRAWLTVFVSLALIYNPIIKFTATREIWVFINFLTIISFISFIWKGRVK